MSFDLLLWRPRKGTRRARGFVYSVLSADVPCDAVDVIDAAAITRDLDQTLPSWNARETTITLVISTVQIEASLGWTNDLDRNVAALRALARRHGLEVFDPQAERVTAEEERNAAAYVASQREEASEEDVGVWSRAASEGDASAMNELGNAYSWGDGVRENAVLAAQWYARAAALNHAGAMANLAECYRCGEGVVHDPDLAARWYEEAGEHGNVEAFVRLAELYRAGDRMPCDPARSRGLLERAMVTDRQVSPFLLAEMTEAGEGGPRDIQRAKELYRLALENRHPEARLRLRRLGEEV